MWSGGVSSSELRNGGLNSSTLYASSISSNWVRLQKNKGLKEKLIIEREMAIFSQ